MHKLSRQIRFAVEPFSNPTELGANSYCAKPTSNALSLFFTLWVELAGITNKETGFVINVSDIDKIIREKGITNFDDFLKHKFKLKEQISFEEMAQILSKVWKTVENEFLPAKVESLFVELAPARKLGIKEIGGDMLYFSEKFEFSSSHTLWNDKFSDTENEKVFGKCANKTGHGHNYIIEVTIIKSTQQSRDSDGAVSNRINAGDFERIVQQEFINVVDHKNLNTDIAYFKKINPTVENIAEFAFKSLEEKLKPMKLDCVTVWENDRTFCSFKAD